MSAAPPDFEDPAFDPEAWAEEFEDAPAIGEALEMLLDRPSSTTSDHGAMHTTIVFVGQELDAIRALVQRLHELS